MLVTMKDVALKAGVSKSAVSRTFTEGASVSEKTRIKVEAAAKELGFQPNVLASSLTTRRTKLIGLISNNFHNPVFLEVFDLFTQVIQKQGLRPLLVNLSEEMDPRASLNMLLQYSVDGVILASSTLPSNLSAMFAEAGVPVVHSFGRCERSPNVHIIGVDNRKCGRNVAKALVDRGYQRFGFLGGPSDSTSTQDRLTGFKQGLKKHGLHNNLSINYAGQYSFDEGFKSMSEILQDCSELAQVYFCGDDVISIGAISAIQSAGLSVPEDIGIIGFNDMEMAGWNNIGLTTVRQPVREIILSSVDILTNMVNGGEVKPEVKVIPCEIVERNTLKARA